MVLKVLLVGLCNRVALNLIYSPTLPARVFVRPCFNTTIVQRSTALFKLLDTDNNGLIDAIEFVSAMACASGELLMSLVSTN